MRESWHSWLIFLHPHICMGRMDDRVKVVRVTSDLRAGRDEAGLAGLPVLVARWDRGRCQCRT